MKHCVSRLRESNGFDTPLPAIKPGGLPGANSTFKSFRHMRRQPTMLRAQ